MQLQLEIPDDVLKALSTDEKEGPRAALEAVALEGYRSRRLSEHQVQRMLGLGHRLDVHAFLKEHHTPVNYSIDDLEHDLDALEDLRRSA